MAKCQGDSAGLPLRGKLTTLSRKDPHLLDMRHRKEYWDKCWARPLISSLKGACEVSLGSPQNKSHSLPSSPHLKTASLCLYLPCTPRLVAFFLMVLNQVSRTVSMRTALSSVPRRYLTGNERPRNY